MFIALIFLVNGLWPAVYSIASEGSDPRLKALYICNLLQFTEWPNKSFNSKGSITIGILGKDPFGDAFLPIVGSVLVGRQVLIKRFTNIESIEPCHALFISSSERDRMPEIVDKIKGWNVLTISDMEGFARRGGIVGFVMDNEGATPKDDSIKRRKRFEINLSAAEQAGLKLRSRFLRLADILWNKPITGGGKNDAAR